MSDVEAASDQEPGEEDAEEPPRRAGAGAGATGAGGAAAARGPPDRAALEQELHAEEQELQRLTACASAPRLAKLRRGGAEALRLARQLRGGHTQAEEAASRLKGQLLAQIDTLEEEVGYMGLEADGGASASAPSALRQRRLQWRRKWPLDGAWDWEELERAVNTRAEALQQGAASRGGERELWQRRCNESSRQVRLLEERLADAERQARELGSRGRADGAQAARLQALQDTQLRDLEAQVHEESRARREAAARLEAQGRHRHAARQSPGSSAKLESRLRDLQRESSVLAEECERGRSEVAEAVEAAERQPPSDQMAVALQQRDKALWPLQESLVEAWRREEAAAARSAETEQAVIVMRAELKAEEGATVTLKGEAVDFGGQADRVRSEMAAVFPGAYLGPSPWSAAPADVSSPLQVTRQALRSLHISLTDENATMQREAAALLGPLAGPAVGPPQPMRAGPPIEPLAAPVQAAAVPAQPPQPPRPARAGSGCQRALLAWDSVFSGAAPQNPPALGAAAGGPALAAWAAPSVGGAPGRAAAGAAAGAAIAALGFPSAAAPRDDPPEAPEAPDAPVARALEALEDLQRGRASRQQAAREWDRLAGAEDQRIEALAARRAQNAGVAEAPASAPPSDAAPGSAALSEAAFAALAVAQDPPPPDALDGAGGGAAPGAAARAIRRHPPAEGCG